MTESSNDEPNQESRRRLTDVRLDEETLSHTNADIEHERKVAVFDLLEENMFAPVDAPDGPYHLYLRIIEKRLVFEISLEDGAPVRQLMLSLSPFRRIVKDYFLICESYHEAIRNASPSQIEAIDMGRRGLHNEGSDLLMQRLENYVALDNATSRRLFTLIYVMTSRGER